MIVRVATVGGRHSLCHRIRLADLLEPLHGDDAWDANPWVVAITFDVIKANIDAMEKAP